jgi:hypothetical protein
MALGGSESLNFAVKLLQRYRPNLSLLVIDPFVTEFAGISAEAKRVLASSRRESYLVVFNIWANFVRDVMLQGVLPRVTISKDSIAFQNPVGVTVVRDWHTADVVAVYAPCGEAYLDATTGFPVKKDGSKWKSVVEPLPSDSAVVVAVPAPCGEVFMDTTKGRQIKDGPKWKTIVAPLPSDVDALRGIGKTILVTTVPHPGAEDRIARKLAAEIGAKFVPLQAAGLLLWDYHHVNAASRDRVTSELQAAIRP